jgi:hypothetical protein
LASIAVAVILLVAGAQAAADRVKGVSEKEGKKIVAIFAEHPKLLSVMRRVIAAIDKKNKKANGKRGLLQSEDELCVTYEGSGECDEMTATGHGTDTKCNGKSCGQTDVHHTTCAGDCNCAGCYDSIYVWCNGAAGTCNSKTDSSCKTKCNKSCCGTCSLCVPLD